MLKVALASSNAGKLSELSELLVDFEIELVPQSDHGVAPAEETGASFVENAIIKARHAASILGLPAIADDSGLVVDALDGAPGIHSARFSGPEATDAANIEKLLGLLDGLPVEQRTARFYCCIVYLRDAEDPIPIVCEGEWCGRVLTAPRGSGGFGYDPVFYAPEFDCSAAELAAEQKHAVSHRAKALRRLASRLPER
jgi:XTP/dITP diphosphohydrolase